MQVSFGPGPLGLVAVHIVLTAVSAAIESSAALVGVLVAGFAGLVAGITSSGR
jgi:hypothetical protein